MGTNGALARQREEARQKKKLGRGDPHAQRGEDQIQLGLTPGLGATSHGALGQALSGWSRETVTRAQRPGKKTHERESGEEAARAERKKETRVDKGTRGRWLDFASGIKRRQRRLPPPPPRGWERDRRKRKIWTKWNGIFSFGDFSFIFFVFRNSQIFLTPD
jgi:hypothetical protein